VDFVGAESNHGGGGGALERRVEDDALVAVAQKMDQAQGGFGVASVRLEEEPHRGARLARVEQLRHGHDVVLADGPARGGPVGQERQAHLLLETGEDGLGFLR
jgi:hypothetical protein